MEAIDLKVVGQLEEFFLSLRFGIKFVFQSLFIALLTSSIDNLLNDNAMFLEFLSRRHSSFLFDSTGLVLPNILLIIYVLCALGFFYGLSRFAHAYLAYKQLPAEIKGEQYGE